MHRLKSKDPCMEWKSLPYKCRGLTNFPLPAAASCATSMALWKVLCFSGVTESLPVPLKALNCCPCGERSMILWILAITKIIIIIIKKIIGIYQENQKEIVT